MSVIQNFNAVSKVFCNQLFHLFCKRTRIAYRRSFLDTACEYNGIRTTLNQFLCPQYGLLSRTSAAVYKADNFYILLYAFNPLFFSDHAKICCSRTIVFCLHTYDNPYFHIHAPPQNDYSDYELLNPAGRYFSLGGLCTKHRFHPWQALQIQTAAFS